MAVDSKASTTTLYAQQLHLHTLDTLCNDLVGGHAIEYGSESQLLSLSKKSRSVLSWYSKNQLNWKKNLSGAVVQEVLSSIHIEPPVLEPAVSASSIGEKKLLRLIKLEAHRFAGIHSYGTEAEAPENFIFEPNKPITMFEGANGSGKTSLMNAIVWCLTGELIRPQRPPERGDIEFEIEIERNQELSSHSIPPVTPMPRPSVYAPGVDNDKIPVDTWVELTFEDQEENVLPVIRRSLSRTNRGKIQESVSDLSILGIDPISFRIGTSMPALLPFIQVGEQSELGQAVAELTGLSSLIDLSKHATKVAKKISSDLTKAANDSIEKIDQDYGEVLSELEEKLVNSPALAPTEIALPKISNDEKLESKLEILKSHFESCKISSFADAVTILGDEFDANDEEQIKNIENMISPGIAKIDEIRDLPSASRLSRLAAINDDILKSVEELLKKICDEAITLADLAVNPDIAKRKKLYARVAEWMKEFDIDMAELNSCPVCLSDVKTVKDPVTDNLLINHIEEYSRAGINIDFSVY